ncbi:MAG TPA: methyl-accepting chemotaxis protein [Dongiaceae bacterium]|nr:methyl-accepting chemotaxis protein [Dongiaceae bacterium]
MNNLKIRTRLIIVLVFVTIMIALLLGVGLRGMVNSNTSLEMYRSHSSSLRHLAAIQYDMSEAVRELGLALIIDSGADMSRLNDHPLSLRTQKISNALADCSSRWKAFTSAPPTVEEKSAVEKANVCRVRFLKAVTDAVGLMQEGKFKEAAVIAETDVATSLAQAQYDFDVLVKVKENVIKREYESAGVKNSSTRNVLITIFLSCMLFAVYRCIMLIREIGSATGSLIDASRLIAGGDLSARVTIDARNEFGDIGRSFNRISEEFQAFATHVSDSAKQLTSASALLHATAGEMSSGAEEVASEVGTVAVASEQMAATSTEIANNCSLAAESSRNAAASASDGAHVVKESLAVMGRIAEQVIGTAKTIEKLGAHSDQIGEIVATIQDIADQTNLLALNAAIEAARAGDQGRGFAVVADEVRALAERTTRATREIGEMIKTIQTETRGAVLSMAGGVKEVERGTAEAARSGAALQNILNRINEVTMQINQIATAAEEQTATTGEISGNIFHITEVVKTTAKGAQDSEGAASSLSSLASGMLNLVGRYKVA